MLICKKSCCAGGEIIASDGLREAYTTGRGTIVVRAKMHIEETSKKKALVVITELPYQTNKVCVVTKKPFEISFVVI